MSLILYYAPFSTAGTTRVALEELGIPYQKVRLDLSTRDTDRPEFRRLNPNGQVPLIVDDGQPIFESAAIALYLGETFGVERGLFPAPGLARGVAMQWIVWANVSLAEVAQRYRIASSPSSPSERHNQALASWAKQAVADRLRILDQALSDRPYLLGSDYSLVDTHLAAAVHWIASLELVPGDLPALGSWLERCTARPAFVRIMSGDA